MLNYALGTFYGIAACQEFMTCGGASVLIAILDSGRDMEEKKLEAGSSIEKHGISINYKFIVQLDSQCSFLEHLFSILASLFANLAHSSSDHDIFLKKLLVLFKEKDFARLKRLLLYRYYYQRCVMKAEQVGLHYAWSTYFMQF